LGVLNARTHQTGFAPQMNVHVRSQDIPYHKAFAAAGLVKHLIGCRHAGGVGLHGGEMKLMPAHRFSSR
jgi:hypothetical protein